MLEADQPMKNLSKQMQRIEVIEGKPAVTMGLDLGVAVFFGAPVLGDDVAEEVGSAGVLAWSTLILNDGASRI
jgi:hypothetical protein